MQKTTPAGEEIRRALLISIGNLGGGGAANPVGDVGRRRPSPDRDGCYIARARFWRKRRMGMAPMQSAHMPAHRRSIFAKSLGWWPGVGKSFRDSGRKPCALRKIITPAGGGGPAGVTKDDWQLGGGVLPIVSEGRWEEECVAPNSMSIPVSGVSGPWHHAGRSTISPSRSSVALHYAAPRFPGQIISDPMSAL